MNRTEPKRTLSRLPRWLPVVLALSVLFASPLLMASSPVSKSVAFAEPMSSVERQVREWASVLSAQQPFSEWKDAKPDVQALGPGTHGWLAILKKNGRTVGYMVVHAASDGTYRLGEYGAGPNVLFSPAALRKSLLENGLIRTENEAYSAIRHYYHPFAAVWEVTVGRESYWIDAKTGELLPFDRAGWEKALPLIKPLEVENAGASNQIGLGGTAAAGQSAVSWMREDSFDPYENLPWLTGKAPVSVRNGKKVQSLIRGGLHLRYVTEPYGDAALYALPVVGFVDWSGGSLDLALDMEGNRFIPILTLQKLGRFYE
ncbi:hypothetical protein GE107_03580 [Cohnella sp. CFH 77786]|uniref:hypothetical protein n=1 Tax=Cohnella sp. CFH 77786 TaxID=2662265 RepID=UPI001C60A785|nr:hypothetical protein [Cohnella sp. CFH 77786]MBW5445144.1 hypothetical protein [Cohnella sp. CFH 77786]